MTAYGLRVSTSRSRDWFELGSRRVKTSPNSMSGIRPSTVITMTFTRQRSPGAAIAAKPARTNIGTPSFNTKYVQFLTLTLEFSCSPAFPSAIAKDNIRPHRDYQLDSG